MLNLVGSAEQGVDRLLEDLMGIGIQDQRFLLVDMREFRQDAQAFVRGISVALGAQEPVQDFDEWVDALQLHGGRLCLMLHHFDHIDRSEHGPYGASFFTTLSRFFLIPSLSLLAVTAHPLVSRLTELEQFFSQADFEPDVYPLPPLSLKRMQEEITRQFPLWNPDMAVAMAIYSHPHAYLFLQYVLKRISSLGATSPNIGPKEMAEFRVHYDSAHGLTPPPSPEKVSWWNRWFNR